MAPQGNSSGVVNARLFRDPADYFLIGLTCRDELFELSGINPSEIEKCAVKHAIVMVGSGPTCEFNPAFVERQRLNNPVRY